MTKRLPKVNKPVHYWGPSQSSDYIRVINQDTPSTAILDETSNPILDETNQSILEE
jgi:hypothetical protein